MDKKNNTNIFWGLILIIIGVAFLADLFYPLSFGRIIGYAWPLILVALGVSVLIQSPGRPKGAFILIGLGAIFFVGNFTQYGIWNLWPLILIIIGASALLSSRKNNSGFNMSESTSGEDVFDHTIVFWGLDQKITSQNFKGGGITAIFGGASIDLTQAKLAEGARLNITAIFGGVEIKVSPTMNVTTNVTGIIGGFENKVTSKPDSKELLTVTGQAIFGGAEVR